MLPVTQPSHQPWGEAQLPWDSAGQAWLVMHGACIWFVYTVLTDSVGGLMSLYLQINILSCDAGAFVRLLRVSVKALLQHLLLWLCVLMLSNTSSNHNLVIMRLTHVLFTFLKYDSQLSTPSWCYFPESHSCQGSVWCATDISEII